MSTPACRFCRHVNPAGAKFCNECGSPLHLRPCPTCEAITDASAQACHQCGASFGDDTEKAPSSDASHGDAMAERDRHHVPESLAAHLDVSAAARAPSMGAPEAGRGSAAAGDGERTGDAASPWFCDTARVAVGDGEEILADDAVAARAAAPESRDAAVGTHVAKPDRRNGASSAQSATRAAGAMLASDTRTAPSILAPDAADRPARRPARGNPLHPVAWVVVLAAVGGATYYAYVERAQWRPWIAGVTSLVARAPSQGAPNAAVAPARDGQAAATPPTVSSPPDATTTGAAERASSSASSPGAAAITDARPAGTPGAAPGAPTTANVSRGDAATARRAAETSRAPESAPAVAAPAQPLPATPPVDAKGGAPKGGASKAVASKASTPRRTDAARSLDATKPADADALATRRLIERELRDFPPPDARRPPPRGSPGSD